MYGPDEHRGALKRLGAIARDVEHARELIQGLRDDLRDDSHDETQTSRDELAGASRALGAALAAFDSAATSLPTPVATDYGAAFRALHGEG